MSSCPRCVRPVPTDATQCPTCGYDIHGESAPDPVAELRPGTPSALFDGVNAATPSDETGLIAPMPDEDASVIPAFTDGRSQVAGPAEKRPGRRWGVGAPLVIGIAVLAVIAVLAASRMAHNSGTNATAGKPAVLTPAAGSNPSGAASGPGSAWPANSQQALAQASRIEGYLRRSRQARHDIGTAINAVSGCTDITSAVATLHYAAEVRTRIAVALASTHVSALPHGAAAVADLRRAMRASASADRHYAAWGHAVAGCHGHAPRDAELVAAHQSDTRASAIKQRFADEWNPIATRYGLATQNANTI